MYSLTLLIVNVAFALSTTSSDQLNATTEEFQKNMEEIIKKLPSEDGGQLIPKVNGFQRKIANIQQNLKEINLKAKDRVESTEKLIGAITSIGGSTVKLFEGLNNGNWEDMIIGALGIFSGVTALSGPLGALVSSALSVLSIVIGAFGKSQKAEESQESMLKRVITDAIERARAEDLKADAEGLMNMMVSIRTSIRRFRNVSTKTLRSQANQIFTQFFTGVDFLGKLKREIGKFCDITDQNTIRDDKFKIYGEKADKCLVFLNLFSDLSMYRKYLIIDMASLFSVAKLKKISNNLLSSGEEERVKDNEVLMFLFDPINNPAKRFCITQFYAAPSKYPSVMKYSNILHKLHNEKIPSKGVVVCSDNALFGYCYKLNLKKVKQAHYESNIKNWQEHGFKSMYISESFKVTGYSKESHKGEIYGPFFGPTVVGMITRGNWKSFKIEETDKDSQKMVRICQKENFDVIGRCDQLDVGIYTDLKFYNKLFGGEVEAIPESQLEYFDNYLKKNDEAVVYDSMLARLKRKCMFPFSFGNENYSQCINNADQSERYYCLITNNKNLQEKAYCLPSEVMKVGGKKYGSCHFPYKHNSIWYTNCDVEGMCEDNLYVESYYKCKLEQSYAGEVASILIPEGLQVEIYAKTDLREKLGTLYGPNDIDKFCQKRKIKSMKISVHQNEVSEMVKICRGTSFSLQCDYLENLEYERLEVNGCLYKDDYKIKSMFVPNGKKVEMWTKENFTGIELGPYTGPLTLNSIEGVHSNISIASLKIINLDNIIGVM